jgi:hypothetical protein
MAAQLLVNDKPKYEGHEPHEWCKQGNGSKLMISRNRQCGREMQSRNRKRNNSKSRRHGQIEQEWTSHHRTGNHETPTSRGDARNREHHAGNYGWPPEKNYGHDGSTPSGRL